MLQRSCTAILALIEQLVAEIWCTWRWWSAKYCFFCVKSKKTVKIGKSEKKTIPGNVAKKLHTNFGLDWTIGCRDMMYLRKRLEIKITDLKIAILQVVEIDPNRILACGFRHTHRCNLNIRLKPSAKSRTYGIDVCWGCQKWQLSVSIYSTLASRWLFFWEGRHPAGAG